VGPFGSLDVKMSCSCRELNDESSVVTIPTTLTRCLLLKWHVKLKNIVPVPQYRRHDNVLGMEVKLHTILRSVLDAYKLYVLDA
jgi:hypothetical protein